MAARLDRDRLIEAAVEQAGLDDLGDLPFVDALDVLIASLERDARLDEVGVAAADKLILSMVQKRLLLVRDRRENPDIAAETIIAPVFIIGLPRTGSTHLHALMAQVEGARTPLMWEMSMPSPPPRLETYQTDPRIAQAQAGVDALGPDFQRFHTLAATTPEQCNLLNDWSFVNQAWTALWEVTSYKEWIYDHDYLVPFEAHRRTLQQLQWKVPGTWVLKYPKHLMTLEALLTTYPDARFVWTHRDPGVVIPSVLTLTGYYRSQNPSFDPVLFAREWASLEELVARRGVAVRDRTPGFEDRCIDVYFRDLMTDPHGTVGRICALAGLSYGDESRHRVQSWLDDHPRDKHGQNRYTAEASGLSADNLRRRFRFYIDRFDVPVERK